MKSQSSIEDILNKDYELNRKVSMLAVALEHNKESRKGVLCYCASISELYEEFCAFLAKKMNILPNAIFKVSYQIDEGRNALGEYLLSNISSIERAPGDTAFIQAKGFTELMASIQEDDIPFLYRFGHDYSQMAIEDFHRNLGRKPSKVIFSLTHIDKAHAYYERAIKTALVSQFNLLIFDI